VKEKHMQAMSLQYLALHPEIEVLRIPDEVYLCLRLAADGKAVPRWLGIKARAALAGWPDELLLKGVNKCPYAVVMIRENKTEKGKLTPAQKELYERLDKKGIPYKIPRTLDENLEHSKEFIDYQWPIPVENGST
jgi:hypothetical protein